MASHFLMRRPMVQIHHTGHHFYCYISWPLHLTVGIHGFIHATGFESPRVSRSKYKNSHRSISSVGRAPYPYKVDVISSESYIDPPIVFRCGQFSWLECLPVTQEVVSSSLVGRATFITYY